jgi:hypothetical protein
MRAFHQRWPEPLVATVVALLTLAVPSGAEAEGAAATRRGGSSSAIRHGVGDADAGQRSVRAESCASI